MLNLKDFKKHEIAKDSLLEKIKGGISCSQVLNVIEALLDGDSNDVQQAHVVTAMYVNGNLQCN